MRVVLGSDIVSTNVFGKRTILVNSYAAAQDLFMKRSSIYNHRYAFHRLNQIQTTNRGVGYHRPEMPMLNDL